MMTNKCAHVKPIFFERKPLKSKSLELKPFSLWPYLEVCSTAVLLGILLFAPTLTTL